MGRIMGFFPSFVFVLLLFELYAFAVSPGVRWVFILLFTVYGFPVICFRLHERFFPLTIGLTNLASSDYSPWWGGHQIQQIYLCFPAFEAALRCIPGAYSAWLRCWGSQVGAQVYWTPGVEITDRSLMKIGNGVIFGHKTICVCHVVSPKRERLLLFVKPIEIGNGAFIGAGSRLGPGVRIGAGSRLSVLTDLYVNKKIGARLAEVRP